MTDESNAYCSGDQAHLSATESTEPDAEMLEQPRRDVLAIKCARLVVALHVLALLVAGHCMRLCVYYLAYPLKLKFDRSGFAFPAHIVSEINFVMVIDNYWYLLFVVAIPVLVINYRTALSIGRTLGPCCAEWYGIALTCLIASRAVYTCVVFQLWVIR
jgi:hypothetical protein